MSGSSPLILVKANFYQKKRQMLCIGGTVEALSTGNCRETDQNDQTPVIDFLISKEKIFYTFGINDLVDRWKVIKSSCQYFIN